MSCSGSICSCGKGNHSSGEESHTLVQMSSSRGDVSTHDFLRGVGSLTVDEEVVEIRFTNNREAFFRNSRGFIIQKDDRVVVEIEGRFDLGTVSLNGDGANNQFDQKNPYTRKSSLRRIDSKATQMELHRWLEAKRRERDVLLQARSIAASFQLDVSISDV